MARRGRFLGAIKGASLFVRSRRRQLGPLLRQSLIAVALPMTTLDGGDKAFEQHG